VVEPVESTLQPSLVEPGETTRIVGCSRGKAKAAWVLVVERVEALRRFAPQASPRPDRACNLRPSELKIVRSKKVLNSDQHVRYPQLSEPPVSVGSG
jgi:hypothetical protein